MVKRCSLTRSQVARIVITVIEDKTGKTGLKQSDRLSRDLRIDRIARRSFYVPVRNETRRRGCGLRKIGAGDFMGAKTVKEIVDKVWSAIRAWEEANS